MAGIDLYSWRVVLAESFQERGLERRPNLLVYDSGILESLVPASSFGFLFRDSDYRRQRMAECAFGQQIFQGFYKVNGRVYHEARTPVSEAFDMDDLVHQYEVRCNGTVTRSVIFTVPDSCRNALRKINVFTTDAEKAKRWLEDIAKHPGEYSWEKRLLPQVGPTPGTLKGITSQ